MIKNQLYPYVEKYINEYLYGFTKEQLDVGVLNGMINLDKINVRPDKANEKLDKQDSPIWLKAGLINKINVGCSLMNFIGEKPLEAEISDVEILLCPSFKWIIRNQNSFLEETEEHIREEYDPKDNNSKEFFFKKVHIFDGSIFKKKAKLLEFLKDTSKIAEIIHKIFTKAIKFFYQSNFYINVNVKNIHIRFEDDTFNYFGGTIFGLHIEQLEISLSADGSLKKDNFKLTNLNVYHEEVKSGGNFLVSSNLFLSKLNNDIIEEDYYKIIDEIYSNKDKESIVNDNKERTRSGSFNKTNKNKINIINGFNCMGRIGISNPEGKVNLFNHAKQKSVRFYFNLFTNDIKICLNPSIIGKLTSFQDFLKGYFLNDPIQDFKPMRKPYDPKSKLVVEHCDSHLMRTKRKLVVRDWLYYFIWYSRFKTAIYGRPFKNKLQEEFSKYFNICCANQGDIFPQEFDIFANDENHNFDKKLNDSIELKKNKENKSEINSTGINLPGKEKDEEDENLNPDNILLSLNFEINVKSVTFSLIENKDYANSGFKNRNENELAYYDYNYNEDEEKNNITNNYQNNDKQQFSSKKENSISFKMENIEFKFNSNGKDHCDVNLTAKKVFIHNLVNGEPIKIEVTQGMENQLGLDKSHVDSKNRGDNKVQGKFFFIKFIL
jgi:hypothetical protein